MDIGATDDGEKLTAEAKTRLCDAVRARATLYANNPEMGRRGGYEPEQTYNASRDRSSKRARVRVTLRRLETAWLYGVARRDLASHNWVIVENPDGYDDLRII